MLKAYDGDLLCKRDPNGVLHVMRIRPRIVGSFDYEGTTFHYSAPVEDYIISLTDNWGMDGKPVDWGLEPLLRKFRQMDSWRDDTGLDKFAKSRERFAEDKKRMDRNDLRAAAADCRRDFAKSTNDIVIRQQSLDKKYNSKYY